MQRSVFETLLTVEPYISIYKWAASWKKQQSVYAKPKVQISFAVTAKLISVFVFATWIVQFPYFLNPKFQASSHLLCLFSLVCVRPVQNHIVGFHTRRLKFRTTPSFSVENFNNIQIWNFEGKASDSQKHNTKITTTKTTENDKWAASWENQQSA